MSEAPERIWAWCFQSHTDGGWGDWGGYARQDNRFPMDARERATGAEYIRDDLMPAPSVTVKPLEWEDGEWRSCAIGAGAEYLVESSHNGSWYYGDVVWPFATLDAAKDAAQADYEARIMAAIQIAPAKSVTIPEGHPDLNLAAWLDRRREQIGPWADYIIAEVGKLEQEIADTRAQLAASFREGVRRGVGYAAGDLCEDEGCPHHGVRHTHTDDLAAPADAAEALRQIKAAAYRAGQEAMRKSAAETAFGWPSTHDAAMVHLSKAIRALPVEDLPEDQG